MDLSEFSVPLLHCGHTCPGRGELALRFCKGSVLASGKQYFYRIFSFVWLISSAVAPWEKAYGISGDLGRVDAVRRER